MIQKLVPTAFALFVVILAQSAATSCAYAARNNERFIVQARSEFRVVLITAAVVVLVGVEQGIILADGTI